VSLFENVPVTESTRLHLRSEFFNAFNHANFGIPVRDFAPPTFGRVGVASTLNRQIQLGLKFIY
jgi:hypothetical protein